MKYIKFEFASRADMLTKLSKYFEKDGSLKGCDVVELGNEVLTYNVMDGETIVTPATYSDKYSVDVLFHKDFPELAEEVTPEGVGRHIIAGCEELYKERYKEKKDKV
jgi:hypothetical protein